MSKSKITSKALYTQLMTEAAEQPADGRLSMPLAVYLSEALRLATFVQKHNDALVDSNTKKVIHPGLQSVNTTQMECLPKNIADQIVTLHKAVSDAQLDLLKSAVKYSKIDVERAKYLLTEIQTVLWFYFEQSGHQDGLAILQELERSVNTDPNNQLELGEALLAYASLASDYAEQIDSLGGFDKTVIEEAQLLAAQVRNKVGTDRDEKTALINQRNRLISLLVKKVEQVRTAARFVFRHHPVLLRETQSAYLRQVRVAQRKRADEKPQAAELEGGDVGVRGGIIVVSRK